MQNITFLEIPTEYQLKPINNKNNYFDKTLNSPFNTELFLRKLYDDTITIFESFFVVFLDNSLNVKGYLKVSQGGLTQTSVDVRILFQAALSCLSTGIIISHNHPSGKLIPSEADKRLTEKIKEGCKLLDITLFDHIIITEESYYSFADEGII